MSERWSIGFPAACSGDMYATFPLIIPNWVIVLWLAALAIPKSRIFTSPS